MIYIDLYNYMCEMRKMNKKQHVYIHIYIGVCVCVCYMAMSQNHGTLASL
jgi:hypothetical protein